MESIYRESLLELELIHKQEELEQVRCDGGSVLCAASCCAVLHFPSSCLVCHFSLSLLFSY